MNKEQEPTDEEIGKAYVDGLKEKVKSIPKKVWSKRIIFWRVIGALAVLVTLIDAAINIYKAAK